MVYILCIPPVPKNMAHLKGYGFLIFQGLENMVNNVVDILL